MVYLTGDGDWSLWLADAEVWSPAMTTRNSRRLEAEAEAAVAARKVVGPYLMAVALEEGRPQALSTREKIRAQGPTVHRHFGKQAIAKRPTPEDTR